MTWFRARPSKSSQETLLGKGGERGKSLGKVKQSGCDLWRSRRFTIRYVYVSNLLNQWIKLIQSFVRLSSDSRSLLLPSWILQSWDMNPQTSNPCADSLKICASFGWKAWPILMIPFFVRPTGRDVLRQIETMSRGPTPHFLPSLINKARSVALQSLP